MIRVVEQTTEERRRESLALYEQCKPFLKEGLSLRQAVTKVTGKTGGFSNRAWYLELVELAKADNYIIRRR